MLTSIDVKFSSSFSFFTEPSGYKGMFSVVDILQIADVIRRVVFLLCFLGSSSAISSSQNVKCSANAASSQAISVAVHFSSDYAVLLTTFSGYRKRHPNLVNASWDLSQSETERYFWMNNSRHLPNSCIRVLFCVITHYLFHGLIKHSC